MARFRRRSVERQRFAFSDVAEAGKESACLARLGFCVAGSASGLKGFGVGDFQVWDVQEAIIFVV